MAVTSSLNDAYSLTDEQINDFRANGWTLLRGVCSAEEIAQFGPAIEDAAFRFNKETRPIEERDTYGKAFLQIMNLWRSDPVVAEFTLAKRFAGIAAQLLGVDHVRLYHDQALFKEAGGGPTPWHQDGAFWPVEQAKTVTLWMPLIDIPAEMGSMSFADGSHHEGILESAYGISDQSEAFFEGYVLGAKYNVRTSGVMSAGDATFHSGVTFHRAPGNPTDRVRSVMTVIYIADGMHVQTPQNAFQENDLATWFPGLCVGDLAASEINPLLI